MHTINVQQIDFFQKMLYTANKGGFSMLNNNSIIYASLYDEYQRNLRMQELSKNVISESPKGSIQIVKRCGHAYYYLKHRENNKVVSQYLGRVGVIDISSIEKEIEQRRRHEAILRRLKSEENWLKSNLKINGGQ